MSTRIWTRRIAESYLQSTSDLMDLLRSAKITAIRCDRAILRDLFFIGCILVEKLPITLDDFRMVSSVGMAEPDEGDAVLHFRSGSIGVLEDGDIEPTPAIRSVMVTLMPAM